MRLISSSKGLAEGFRKRFKRLVHIGIGGSCLGPKAIVSFLGGDREVFFLDSTDPESLRGVESLLKDACIAVVSKSGKTLETILLFGYVASVLEKMGISWEDRTVFVTSPDKNNPLLSLSKERKVFVLEIPREIPGRFSVLSPVGLFPGFFSGINMEDILEGAAEILEGIEKDRGDILSQLVELVLNLERYPILVLFYYSQRLWNLSRWIAQLVAESLGKEGKGITPLVCEGPADQHSYLQLFMEGPDDKFYVFLRKESFLFDPFVGELLPKDFLYLLGKRFSEIFLSEEEGTRLSLKEADRSVMLFPFKGEPRELGRFFMIWQLAVSTTARIMGVDPYTQNGVERGKEITRRRLSEA